MAGSKNLVEATLAATNNAMWCDAVCRAHGIAGTFGTDAWTSDHRTPPLYPDAVTLVPNVLVPALLARIDASSGSSVKDSFAALDLGDRGFRILFDAEWIGWPVDSPIPVDEGPTWQRVTDALALREWTGAWRQGDAAADPFLPALLNDPDIAVVATRVSERIIGGAVLNAGGGAVGIGNVFGSDEAWRGALGAAARLFPHLPIVGYESGAALSQALQQGFISLGPLRVWLR